MKFPRGLAQLARRRLIGLAAIPTLCAGLVGLLWTRGERILGNDSFHYLEFAKSFRETFPGSFGSHWPYGYPLVGTTVDWIVRDAWLSLLLVSGASLAGCFGLVATMLDRAERPRTPTLVVFTALAASPTIAGLLYGTMSELTFSVLVLGQAFAMAEWPSKRAILMSSLLALASFGIRYVGAAMVCALVWWVCISSRVLRANQAMAFARGTIGLTVLLGLGLLWTNFRLLGHLSGGHRDPGGGLSTFPNQLAQLGLALPSSVTSGQLGKLLGGVDSVGGLLVGAAFMALCCWLCLASFRRPSSAFSRPVSLIASTYVASMALLRSLWSFDDLSGGRAIVPVVFPLLFLTLERYGKSRRNAIIALGTAVVAVGVGAALRGISPETHGDLRQVRESVLPKLDSGMLVSTNDAAISTAAYLPNRVVWAHEPTLEAIAGADLVVVAAKRVGRFDPVYKFDPAWMDFCASLQSQGDFEVIQESPAAIVLQRSRSRIGPGHLGK